MTCNTSLTMGHGYIIVVVDYFTKWAKAMPTYDSEGKIAAQFLFNHVITWFGVWQDIITNHFSHFWNYMMIDLTTQLGLHHDNSTPYHSQVNDQVQAIHKGLIIILQHTIGMHKQNWHLMLFLAPWAYWTATKETTGFTPFQLVYGLEATLPIECQICSLKLVFELLPRTSMEKERLLYLERLDETRHIFALVIKAQKKQVKAQYDKTITPRVFLKVTWSCYMIKSMINWELGIQTNVPWVLHF